MVNSSVQFLVSCLSKNHIFMYMQILYIDIDVNKKENVSLGKWEFCMKIL